MIISVYLVFTMLYILGVILLVLTTLSGLTILIQGYMPEDEDSNTTYMVVLMIASGLFGAFMTCLDKHSNVGIIWLSYILVLLGVLAVISLLSCILSGKIATRSSFGD